MDDIKQTLTIIFWTIVCIVGDILIIQKVNQDQTYDITTTTKRINISSEIGLIRITSPISIKAGSSEHFLFTNEEYSDVINAEPKDRPLGWLIENYYYAEKTEIAAGTWLVSEVANTIEIEVTAQTPTTITFEFSEQKKVSSTVGISFIALIVWFIGLAVYINNMNN